MDAPDPARHDPTVRDATVVDDPAAELAAGTQFAGYVIEGVAGRGGMGVVYRARQLRPSRTVALKVISPALAGDADFRERFARESEIAASIEHSNVIPVYEVGEDAGLLYIVMRYVEGTDLRAVIAAEGRLAPRRAAGILSELAAALDAAHARGLVHRDIKPGNVLIAGEGRREHVYLTDFGLAKLAGSDGRTRTGTFVGTLDYAAPEQVEGRRVDARTDVYAAGCVFFQMLTGSVPFPKEHEAAVMWAHMSAAPRSVRELVPGLPAELDAVIARAMAKNPDDRYASAGDLGRDALAAAEGRRGMLLEQSIATGRAAPQAGSTVAPEATPEVGSTVGPEAAPEAGSTVAPEAAPSAGPPRRRTGLIAAGTLGALVILVAVLLAAGVFSSGGTGHHANVTTHGQTTPSPAPAPTTTTYVNSKLGVGFKYPASWEPLTLKGAPADFGIAAGTPHESRCALEIERGSGPAGSSQEARFAFVRDRSAIAAHDAKHYELRAIQAEQGANITGVGLIRVADGQGGHLGFFFRGRDVYIFDCITPAASLDQIDREAFVPLLASVSIG